MVCGADCQSHVDIVPYLEEDISTSESVPDFVPVFVSISMCYFCVYSYYMSDILYCNSSDRRLGRVWCRLARLKGQTGS